MALKKADAKAVLLIDSKGLMEEAFGDTLLHSSEVRQVYFTADIQDAADRMEDLNPDAVLIDLRLDSGACFAALEYFMEYYDELPLLVCSYTLKEKDGKDGISALELAVPRKPDDPRGNKIGEATSEVIDLLMMVLPVPVVKTIRKWVGEERLSEPIPVLDAGGKGGGTRSGAKLKFSFTPPKATAPAAPPPPPPPVEAPEPAAPEPPPPVPPEPAAYPGGGVAPPAPGVTMPPYYAQPGMMPPPGMAPPPGMPTQPGMPPPGYYPEQGMPQTAGEYYTQPPMPQTAGGAPPPGTTPPEPAVEKLDIAIPENPLPDELPSYIAIGMGEGAEEALKSLLSRIKTDLFPPIFVTMHYGKDVTADQVAKRLDRELSLTVQEAMEFTKPDPGNVYLSPEVGHLQLGMNRRIQIVTASPNEPYCPSIDILLETLAVDFPSETIACILNGSGDDGSIGAQALHDAGGYVIAQHPSSCPQPEMPTAALEIEGVDRAMTLNQLRAFFVKLARIASMR